MSVCRCFFGQMGFMESKESSFVVVKINTALRIRACGKHHLSRVGSPERSRLTDSCLHVDLDRNLRIPASRSLIFQPLDSDPQPLSECRLQLFLRSRPVEAIDRGSTIVQLNVAARNISVAAILRYQLREQAIAAWLGRLRWIKIQTTRRILKYELRPPRRSRGMAISACFQKIQFSL
jgi:hypothetical protein